MGDLAERSLFKRFPIRFIRPAGAQGGQAARSQGSLRFVLIALLSLLPTILAVLYYGVIATDRYVSETRFVVRTAARPNVGSGLASLLQMTGISRAQDDTFAVQDFMMSRSAITGMPPEVDLRRIYGGPGVDFLARYPSILYGSSVEELHRFMRWMIALTYDPNTSITTLKVQAFSAEDARLVAKTLLDMAEEVVNRINARIRDDAIRVANEELKRAEEKVIEAQVKITKFRNDEMMLDPTRNSVLVIELVGRLSSELAQTRAQITEMMAGSPDNPQLASLYRRAGALETQINTERARITTASDGLADKISTYEQLMLNKEFSAKLLGTALNTLEAARAEARRQQLYLQRIVEPTLPDHPTEPTRLYNILTVLAGNLLLLLIAWLLLTGLNSHGFR